MNQLDRYIARTIGSTIVLAVLGLVGIMGIFTFLEQVDDIQNNYTLGPVMVFVLLSIPRMFYETLPYAALIGCLAGLGILANNSELVVMRAAGVSTWKIAVNAMKPTLVLVAVGLVVGEFILPDVEQTARVNREKAISVENHYSPTYGMWYREGDVYMHFDEVQGRLIEGVKHYYFDSARKLTRSLSADRAVFHDVSKKERYWLLENVRLTDFTDERTETHRLPSLRWDTGLEPDLLSTESLVRPDKMSIGELNKKINYMQAQGLNSNKYELGFWRKVLQPLATIALVFVAISFIFGPLREATMGTRVVSGLVIGIVFKFIQDLLAPASMVFGFSPAVSILVPILLCVVFGYWLLRRAG